MHPCQYRDCQTLTVSVCTLCTFRIRDTIVFTLSCSCDCASTFTQILDLIVSTVDTNNNNFLSRRIFSSKNIKLIKQKLDPTPRNYKNIITERSRITTKSLQRKTTNNILILVTLQLVTSLHMHFYLHVSVSAATPTSIARPTEFLLVALRSSVSLAVATAVICPGRKPPFLSVKHPVRQYKSAIEN